MGYREDAAALRQDDQHHYNCAQAVLMPFAERCGLTRDQAETLGSNFGSGMHCGGTCGAVTGALMVLGLAGKDEAAAKAMTSGFQGKNSA
ncbi:MAG: C-GCAxxG-C-C family protein, partial [Pseudoflavonifractor sp.]